MRVVTAAEMADLEAQSGVSEDQLAENAGYRIAQYIDRNLDEDSVTILCGPGNNGADGMIAAYHLVAEFGLSAEVLLAADPDKLRPLGKKAYRRLAETDCEVLTPGSRKYERKLECLWRAPCIVDCLLGTGQKGPPRGEVARALDAVGSGSYTVTVDVPTGIDSDTGEALGTSMEPGVTLVLGYPKPYLFTGVGRAYAEHWRLVPIGLHDGTESRGPRMLERASELPVRDAFSHKKHSVVLSIAGSRRYPGAAALAALGAMRMGAGMVVAASTEDGLASVRSTVLEAPLAILPGEDGAVGSLSEEDFARLASDCSAIVVGPGLSLTKGAGDIVAQACGHEAPKVIDGDGLRHFADRKISLEPGTAVLTPHAGEATFFLGGTSEEVDAARFASAQRIAEDTGQTVVLKGLHPIVASPGRSPTVIASGSPLLATAGTGDVLAGMIGALLAQGLDCNAAAETGAHLHGMLAEIVSARIGGATYGVLASEMSAEIPVALALAREGTLLPRCLGLMDTNDEELDEDDD